MIALPPGTVVYDRAMSAALAEAFGVEPVDQLSREMIRRRAEVHAAADFRALQLLQAPIAGFA